MQRKNIILITHPDKLPQVWGAFNKACEANGLPYRKLNLLKFPIEHEGYVIYKLPFFVAVSDYELLKP